MISELPFCQSTNDELLSSPVKLRQHGLAIFTLDQRNGRGRLGRQWLSHAGNLAFSIVLHCDNMAHAHFIPIKVGLAVFRVVRRKVSGIRLKWPNDILAGGAKLGGILCESAPNILHPPAMAVVAGLGLNIVPQDIPGVVTTSFEAHGVSINANQLANDLLGEVLALCPPQATTLSPEFIDEFNYAAALPTMFHYNAHHREYTGLTLLPDGSLLAQDATGQQLRLN